MSGAGRGIPRVSPMSVTPSGGGAGSIIEVPTSKFLYVVEPTPFDFPLIPSYQPVGTYSLPLGVSRAALSLGLVRAVAGVGILSLKILWSDTLSNLSSVEVPASESLGIATFAPKQVDFTGTADQTQDIFYSFVVPPFYSRSSSTLDLQFVLTAAIIGAPSGILNVRSLFADNVSDLPYEPNFTV